jgi:hypothetical protein
VIALAYLPDGIIPNRRTFLIMGYLLLHLANNKGDEGTLSLDCRLVALASRPHHRAIDCANDKGGENDGRNKFEQERGFDFGHLIHSGTTPP